MHQVVAWCILAPTLKSNFKTEKDMVMGHHTPYLHRQSWMGIFIFFKQNSCFLQPDKSPSLLLSGKEAVIQAVFWHLFSLFWHLFHTIFLFYFWTLQKLIPHYFCPWLWSLSPKAVSPLSTHLSLSQNRICSISLNWSNPMSIFKLMLVG